MVPDVAGKGHSFAGAMRYYLSDKRQPGQKEHPTTSERVAWVQTRNLPVEDPRIAMGLMIATASQAEDLKRMAGVKSTGRRSTKAVYAFSLSWHPSEAEGLTRDAMLKAADEAMAALGIAHLQAVIVCHRDQPHPHIHVIVNRVDPSDGRMAVLSKDRELLSRWAHGYERERGPLLTPKRAEKYGPEAERQRAERRSRQERERDAAASVRQPADMLAGKEKVAEPGRQRIAGASKRERQPSQRAMLAQLDKAQHARHAEEWQALDGSYKAGRQAIIDRHMPVKAILAEYAQERRAAETALRDEQRRDLAAHDAKGRGLFGRVRNAIDAAREAAGPEAGRLALAKRAIGFALSPEAVRQNLAEKQRIERETLAATSKARLAERIAAMKLTRHAELTALTETHAKEREALIGQQAAERAKMKEAWSRAQQPERGKRQQTRERDAERQRDEGQRRERTRRPRSRERER